jgi:hypothetical protein
MKEDFIASFVTSWKGMIKEHIIFTTVVRNKIAVKINTHLKKGKDKYIRGGVRVTFQNFPPPSFISLKEINHVLIRNGNKYILLHIPNQTMDRW